MIDMENKLCLQNTFFILIIYVNTDLLVSQCQVAHGLTAGLQTRSSSIMTIMHITNNISSFFALLFIYIYMYNISYKVTLFLVVLKNPDDRV